MLRNSMRNGFGPTGVIPTGGNSSAIAAADINNNGASDLAAVDNVHLSVLVIILLAAWGQCTQCTPDLTGDCAVDLDDLLILLAHWTA